MKFEYENATVTVHFSERPKEEMMKDFKKATAEFLKRVLEERRQNV